MIILNELKKKNHMSECDVQCNSIYINANSGTLANSITNIWNISLYNSIQIIKDIEIKMETDTLNMWIITYWSLCLRILNDFKWF